MKLTADLLKRLVKEELVKESIASDEKNLKDSAVQALISLYFRHDILPEDAAKELSERQSQK